MAGNDSLPAVIVSVRGFSPPDTFGVQSVAVCCGALRLRRRPLVLVGEGAAVDGLPWLPPRITIRVATSAMTPRTARPARINHGSFERGPFGGGPGG